MKAQYWQKNTNQKEKLFFRIKNFRSLRKIYSSNRFKVETKNNSVYYSNRALVNLKLENNETTIQDTNTAIKINPEF